MNDPALPRFIALQMIRLSGALIVLLGVAMMSGRFAAFARVPPAVGEVLFVAGAVEFFAVPFLMARRWKGRS